MLGQYHKGLQHGIPLFALCHSLQKSSPHGYRAAALRHELLKAQLILAVVLGYLQSTVTGKLQIIEMATSRVFFTDYSLGKIGDLATLVRDKRNNNICRNLSYA